MKNILIAGLMVCTGLVSAKKKIEKTIPVKTGQKVEMDFRDPELIKVHTWDKNEILVKGHVSINRGENDDAFEITVGNDTDVVQISATLKDRETIPRRIVIKKDDQEYYFRTNNPNDPAILKFQQEHGRDYTYMSNGIIMDIVIEVWVPKGVATRIDAKYGLVEVTAFEAPLVVNATYGGIDATVTTSRTGDLVARTRYGEILTNLDVKFDPLRDNAGDHWTEVKTALGKGPAYEFESRYGKVYLRKPK